jgi:hypothetical protein
MKSNPPRPNCIWDELNKRWKLGNVYYMPDRTIYSPWCWFDFVKDKVIAECHDPEEVIKINIE